MPPRRLCAVAAAASLFAASPAAARTLRGGLSSSSIGGFSSHWAVSAAEAGVRRALEQNAFDKFLSDNPFWVTLLVYAGIGIGALALLLVSGVCIRRRCCQPRDAGFVPNPYAREWSQEAGGATLIRKNVGKPSAALADFMKHNPADRHDDVNAPPPPAPTAPAKKSAAEMAAYSKRVSTNMTGEDYGRLDAATKDRLRSVRMEGNLKPIGVAKPSAKALKMLGVEADAVERPFDDDIQTRMERVAKGAGGGMYSPGLATARLGGQIADGFKQRRAAQLEKAAQRKEREEARRAEMAQKRASAKAGSQAGSQAAPSKPPPPPPASTKPKLAPGPDKLNAFLSTSGVRAAPEADDKKEEEEEEEEEEESDSDDPPNI